MRLYNTLTRSVQPFVPLTPPAVTIYVCGPTVYDEPHIGHARSAFIFDVLRRYLRSRKFQVTFVRNVTDVDDKIIEKARQETADHRPQTTDLREKCREVAEKYLAKYHEVMDRLGIERPDIEPKATEHVIPDPKNVEATNKIDASMTGFISQLITKNMAYPAGGNVYFSVRKFPAYGQLSNRSLDDLQAGARVEPGEHKDDPLDFALWKAAKPSEPSWNSPWGPGRPGWHIECSVMSTAYLGDAFDIHGGGVDLIFPHHENEITQAQALGKPFAKHWIHNGLLTVKGEKMSKSLGNFITVEQALQECWGGTDHLKTDVLKTFFLGTHYRSPADYTPGNVKAAGRRFDQLFTWCLTSKTKQILAEKAEMMPNEIGRLGDEFERAMDDDLNTPRALATLDKLANLIQESHLRLVVETRPPEEERIDRNRMAWAGALLERLGGVLGLVSFGDYGPGDDVTPEEDQLLSKREEARRRKDFKTADQIRKELQGKGIIIEDTDKGPIVRRKR